MHPHAELGILKNDIKNIRPTQICVGMREVLEKQANIKNMNSLDLDSYLRAHLVPVVPHLSGVSYAVDHHHLIVALLRSGIDYAYCKVTEGVSADDIGEFWKKMGSKDLVYPFDENGIRRDFARIPGDFQELKDDPYRSLAGSVRNAGGFKKDTTPFAEFKWADFFRKEIELEIVHHEYDRAVEVAREVASHKRASHLPGFSPEQRTTKSKP